MCFLNIGLHDGLNATESNERLLNRICDLLDDGKYRNVKHGQIHYLQCCKRLVVHYEKMKDKANLQLSLQKYENFVNELGLQAPKLIFKVSLIEEKTYLQVAFAYLQARETHSLFSGRQS